jgi:hypothetical protein
MLKTSEKAKKNGPHPLPGGQRLHERRRVERQSGILFVRAVVLAALLIGQALLHLL